MSSKFYNNLKTAFLFGAFTALMIFAGGAIGGQRGLIIGLIMAGIGNFIGYFFSAQFALMSMGAREVGPEHPLYQIVQPLAERAGLPMPRVYVSPQPAPNAFATGRNPRHAAVCATEGLLQMLNRNQVAGVMAHELAHVKHRDILIASVAATMAGAISMLPWMFGGRDRDSNPIIAIAAIILAPIAAIMIQMAISRSREFNADKAGAEICGDPMYLATALETIHHGAAQIPLDVNPAYNAMMIAPPMNMMKGFATLFSSHPALEDRLMNLIGAPSTMGQSV